MNSPEPTSAGAPDSTASKPVPHEDSPGTPTGVDSAHAQTLPEGLAREPATPSPVPPPIPDHELIRRIGRGSYGEVWLALNVMGTYRAVKIVFRSSFEHARPFDREFNGIRKFEPVSRTHPALVNILQVGRGQDCFYYVMELGDDVATGQEIDPVLYTPQTLRSEVKSRGHLTPERCVEVGLWLAGGLEHLHRHGLIHRDIKPSNIIFVQGQPKLVDIGLVTEASEAKSFVGTEGFIPPEGPGTVQGDVYSLGKVLYEMATGKDRHEFPELPTHLAEDSTADSLLELNAVMLKACQGEVKRRYASAGALREDLLLLQSGRSVKRAQAIERRLALLSRISAIGVLLTGLISVGFFYVNRLRQRAEQGENSARRNLYAADMLLAQQAWESKNYGRVRELIDRYQQEHLRHLRGWEWRYLWQLLRSDALASFGNREPSFKFVSFSHDSHLLLATDESGVGLWDVKEPRSPQQLRFSNDVVVAVFSPIDHLAAFSGKDGIIRLCNPTLDTTIANLTNGTPPAEFLSFSRNGTHLAARSSKAIVVWNMLERREIIRLPARRMGMHEEMTVFSPDGSLLTYPKPDGSITLFDLNARSERLRLPWLWWPNALLDLEFSPDGRLLAGSLYDGSIVLFDLETSTELPKVNAHSAHIDSLDFSPDGSVLATASADQEVKLWNTRTWKEIETYRGHENEVGCLTFSPDGTLIATGSKDGIVNIWPALPPAREPTYIPGSNDVHYLRDVDFRPGPAVAVDGTAILKVRTNGTYQVIGTSPLTELPAMRLPFPGTNLTATAISTHGQYTAFAQHDGSVSLFASRSATSVRTWTGLGPKVNELAFSYDGQTLAVGNVEGTVTVLNVGQDTPVARFESGSYGYSALGFSRDGSLLGMGTSGEPSVLFDLKARRERTRLGVINNLVTAIAFAPDNSFVALSDWNNMVSFWDARTGQLLAKLGKGQSLAYKSGALSPDGKRFAVGGGDGAVILWDTEQFQQIAVLRGHRTPAYGLAFQSDGNSLVSAASDGSIRIWRAAPWSDANNIRTDRTSKPQR